MQSVGPVQRSDAGTPLGTLPVPREGGWSVCCPQPAAGSTWIWAPTGTATLSPAIRALWGVGCRGGYKEPCKASGCSVMESFLSLQRQEWWRRYVGTFLSSAPTHGAERWRQTTWVQGTGILQREKNLLPQKWDMASLGYAALGTSYITFIVAF